MKYDETNTGKSPKSRLVILFPVNINPKLLEMTKNSWKFRYIYVRTYLKVCQTYYRQLDIWCFCEYFRQF